jgi:hypothetical protein
MRIRIFSRIDGHNALKRPPLDKNAALGGRSDRAVESVKSTLLLSL